MHLFHFGYEALRYIAFKEVPRFPAIVAAPVLRVVDKPWGRYRLVCGERTSLVGRLGRVVS